MLQTTSPAMQNASTENADDIDLLDLLVVMAEHAKLLIITPLLVGLTAFLVSLALPKSYESVSILNADQPDMDLPPSVIVSLIASADFLNGLAADLDIAKDASAATRRAIMAQRVSASTSRQDKLVTLRTLGPTPEQAQKLNAAVWDRLQPLSIPRGGQMSRLQTLLKAEQARLNEGNQLEKNVNQQLQKGQISEQSARLYGELLESNSKRMRAITALQAQMAGLTIDNLVQSPSLPERAIKPRPTLIAGLAILVSGMLLLLFVFARHAMRSSCQRPEQAEKVARLRAAFSKKR